MGVIVILPFEKEDRVAIHEELMATDTGLLE